MNLISLKYALRDMRGGLQGFRIFLICIILSVAIIGGVQSLSLGVKDSIRKDGRYILGGDVSLSKLYEPATREQQAFLRNNIGPTTSVIETRAMARKSDGTKTSLVELKAVDPFYPLYGKLVIVDEAGNKLTDKKELQELLVPPKADVNDWGAVVEKELLSRMNLKIGDRIEIGKQKFELRGIITNEPDRVGGKQFTIAPRVMISNYTFNDTALSTVGSQVEYSYKVLLPYVKNLSDLQKAEDKISQTFPKADWHGTNFLNASPRAERLINRLTLFLTFTGLATLMIGGIGISNAVSAFLEDKIGDIATLKCLGAKENSVMKIYMTEILLLSTIGVIGGVLLAIALSQIGGHFVTTKLVLDNGVGIYPKALLSAAALGYLITVLSSLWPIGRTIRTKPAHLFRDMLMSQHERPNYKIILMMLIVAQIMALISLTLAEDNRFMAFFIIGVIAAVAIFFACSFAIKFVIKRIHVSNNTGLRMALTNLHRPGNMTSSVVLSIGLGLTVLIAVTLVQSNFMRMIGSGIAADAPSFFFMDVQPNQVEKFKSEIAKYKSAHNLNLMPSLRGRIMSVNGVDAEKALVDQNQKWIISSDRGFTYTAKQPANSELIEGKWWSEDYKGKPIISISTEVQKAFNIGVGAKLMVRILGRDVEAEVVNVREISWTNFTLNFATTFAPGALDKFPANYIATLITDKADEEALQNDISNTMPNVTVIRVSDVLEVASKVISNIATAVGLSASVTLIAGLMVLSGGVAAARKRYTYDAIVLKVLGASRRKILGIFLFEYCLLGLITVIVAAILGSVAAYFIQGFMMDLRWHFDAVAVGIITVLCLIVTMTAGAYGTWHVLKQKPASYLRNE